MGGYVRSGPFVDDSSPAITAQFLNNVESVLSRSGGDTETGKYVFEFNSATANYFGSVYYPSLSRTTVPTSVSIDSADVAATSLNSGPTTQHLTSNGVEIVAQTSGNVSDARAGGNITIHY